MLVFVAVLFVWSYAVFKVGFSSNAFLQHPHDQPASADFIKKQET